MANRVHRIRELCDITSSKRIYAADYRPEGVPFYRGKEISEKHRGNIDVSTELFIDRDKYLQIQAKFGAPVAGDLLLTSVGTLGAPYVVRTGEEFYFKDGNLTWFKDFSSLDSRYLYYWLLSPQGRGELQKCTIGSSQSAYTIVLLKEMEIDLPPLPTQHKVAAILSAYDGLIENNLRRIKILEEMAQNLYREWFVKFRFTGHQHARFTDSLLGRIPEGWGVKRLGDAFLIVLGGTPSRDRPEFWRNGTVPWINSGKVNDLRVTEPSELITELALKKSAAKLMPPGTTLIAITGATLGQVSILEIEASANQSVVGVISEDEKLIEWLHLTIRERISSIINHASGGAQQHINKGIVDDVVVAVPAGNIPEKFHNMAQPLYRHIAGLIFKNTTLCRTRDLLLPRLISGDVDVSELDIAVPKEVVT